MSRLAACAALLAVTLCCTAGAATPAWFVVAERHPERGQSFLLPLSDPAHIAAARVLVTHGTDAGVGSIATVRIGAGGDGFNRDVLREGAPLWSWHVAAFEGFFDVAIELCDGWPGLIEEDVAAFIANTQGRACFWGYTVVAELDSAPVFAIGEGLDGAWSDPASPGQGVFVDVLPAQQAVGLGWFAFAPGAAGTPAWWTAHGGYAGASAELDVYHTSGGAFDAPDAVQTVPVGSIELRFEDCNTAVLAYRFDDGTSGSMPLRRVLQQRGCFTR